VAFIYARFGVAASAIHTNTAARPLPCACKKYLTESAFLPCTEINTSLVLTSVLALTENAF